MNGPGLVCSTKVCMKTILLASIKKFRTTALVGAGGKTSLMFFLAHHLVASGKTVITTTTTNILVPTKIQAPLTVLTETDPGLAGVKSDLTKLRHVCVGSRIDGTTSKLKGIDDDKLAVCCQLADHVVVEADGAAGRAVKAPESWEPAIPRNSDAVIFVLGLDCLGKPAHEDIIFRLNRFCEITGLKRGDTIGPEALATLACHSNGGMKNVRKQNSFLVYLNKLDVLHEPFRLDQIEGAFAGACKSKKLFALVAGSVRSEEFVDIPI
jgi:probable selenium-dependent hydroxylase accessory protein YqeC